MLVTDFGTPGDNRGRADERIIERPVSAEERSTIRGVDGLPPKPAAEIGRDTDIVGDAVAETVAAADAPRQIVLAPGEEITRDRAAIAQVLLVQEHTVVEGVEDRLPAHLDVAPGLLDPPPCDKVRREILRRVEEGGVTEAGIGDVGRHRGATDRRGAGSAANGRRRQYGAGGPIGDWSGAGEARAERPAQVRARVLGRD